MIDALKQNLHAHFKHDVLLEIREEDTPVSVQVSPHDLHEVCRFLYENENYYFDGLSCITGIDNGPEEGTMEVIYNLSSIPFEKSLMVRVELDRMEPLIASVADIWRTADWLERETFDLFGIIFSGHPDLRRILLPGDWEGYPLRRDYAHQEYYHGIKVKY